MEGKSFLKNYFFLFFLVLVCSSAWIHFLESRVERADRLCVYNLCWFVKAGVDERLIMEKNSW